MNRRRSLIAFVLIASMGFAGIVWGAVERRELFRDMQNTAGVLRYLDHRTRAVNSIRSRTAAFRQRVDEQLRAQEELAGKHKNKETAGGEVHQIALARLRRWAEKVNEARIEKTCDERITRLAEATRRYKSILEAQRAQYQALFGPLDYKFDYTAGPRPFLGRSGILISPQDYDLGLALDKEVEFSFEGTPLRDVVDFLRQFVQKNVVLDEDAIKEDKRLVTLNLSKVTLRQALQHIIKADMDYVVRHGAIFLSTNERLAVMAPADLRVYDVRDLAGAQNRGRNNHPNREKRFVDDLRRLTGAERWRIIMIGDKKLPPDLPKTDAPEEPQSAQGVLVLRDSGYLFVRQTESIHRRTEDVLEALRGHGSLPMQSPSATTSTLRPLVPHRPVQVPPPRWTGPSLADMDLELALDKEVEFSFEGTPLRDVVDFLRQVVQKNIILDERSILEDQHLVTLNLSRVTLRRALNTILQDNMDYIIKRGAIYISTKERLFPLRYMDFRIYDLSGLLPEESVPALLPVIRELTGPQNWRPKVEAGTDGLRATISTRLPGEIQVCHTRAMHRQVERILTAVCLLEGVPQPKPEPAR